MNSKGKKKEWIRRVGLSAQRKKLMEGRRYPKLVLKHLHLEEKLLASRLVHVTPIGSRGNKKSAARLERIGDQGKEGSQGPTPPFASALQAHRLERSERR